MYRYSTRSLHIALLVLFWVGVFSPPAAATTVFIPLVSSPGFSGGIPSENAIQNAGNLPMIAEYDEAQGEP